MAKRRRRELDIEQLAGQAGVFLGSDGTKFWAGAAAVNETCGIIEAVVSMLG
jgi:hypothetical protein